MTGPHLTMSPKMVTGRGGTPISTANLDAGEVRTFDAALAQLVTLLARHSAACMLAANDNCAPRPARETN